MLELVRNISWKKVPQGGWDYSEKSKKDRGRVKLPEVVISPLRLLVMNADRRAELTGQGCKQTPRAHSLMHR